MKIGCINHDCDECKQKDKKLIELEQIAKYADALNDRCIRDTERIGALRHALEAIIKFNQQSAKDKYGDESKCESWDCVKTARAAIKVEERENNVALERIEVLYKYFSLVDDVCLMLSGWKTSNEQQLYLDALSRIFRHSNELKKQAKIEELKQKITELENGSPSESAIRARGQA